MSEPAQNRNSLTGLGETEIEVLRHLWELKSASVRQVYERVAKERRVAYTTIQTVMNNLTRKGLLVRRARKGEAYSYTHNQSPEAVRHQILESIIQKVFKGSAIALLESLLRNGSFSERELIRISQLLRDN